MEYLTICGKRTVFLHLEKEKERLVSLLKSSSDVGFRKLFKKKKLVLLQNSDLIYDVLSS